MSAARIRELCEIGPTLGWDAFDLAVVEVKAAMLAEIASGEAAWPEVVEALEPARLLATIWRLWHRARLVLGPDAGDADWAADWAAALAVETAERRAVLVVRRREMKASAGRGALSALDGARRPADPQGVS